MDQQLTLYMEEGHAVPVLQGKWFPDGLHGTMGELLCAIEEDRVPHNNAEDNLTSLELCFAAVQSAETNEAVDVGSIKKLPGS